jgi:metal-dependent amidase/aminoacylase/carboxypeptidase family protein
VGRRYLARHNEFAGAVHLIFQPDEETLKGALAMIEDGLLGRFPCDAIYGMHTGPGLPATVFATLPGILTAGAGRFDISVRGKEVTVDWTWVPVRNSPWYKHTFCLLTCVE